MGIDLHIEELVLDGFAARDRHRIAAAMESELTRLLSAVGKQNSLAIPVEIAKLNGGAIRMNAGTKPHEAGTQIARAVFRSLNNPSGIATTARANRGGRGGGTR
jgi:hypothetical protein